MTDIIEQDKPKMLLHFNNDYYRRKTRTGDKSYIPVIKANGADRITRKKWFRTAHAACEYAKEVVSRYNRMF